MASGRQRSGSRSFVFSSLKIKIKSNCLLPVFLASSMEKGTKNSWYLPIIFFSQSSFRFHSASHSSLLALLSSSLCFFICKKIKIKKKQKKKCDFRERTEKTQNGFCHEKPQHILQKVKGKNRESHHINRVCVHSTPYSKKATHFSIFGNWEY